jgi:hypothetical protein
MKLFDRPSTSVFLLGKPANRASIIPIMLIMPTKSAERGNFHMNADRHFFLKLNQNFDSAFSRLSPRSADFA